MEVNWVQQENRWHLDGQEGNYVVPHRVPIGNHMGDIYRIYVEGKSCETRNTLEVAKNRLVEMVQGEA